MLDRGVPGHQVEQDADATTSGGLDEGDHVVVRPVPRRDGQEVGDVVARIPERRGEARVEPHRVHTQPGQVVQVSERTGEIADPVTVGVRERLRVDLVEDRVAQPGGAALR